MADGDFFPSFSEPSNFSQVLFPNAQQSGGGINDASFSTPGDMSQVLFPNASSNTGVFPDPQQQGGGGFDISKLFPAAAGGIGSLIGILRGQGGKGDRALQLQQAATKPLAAAGNQALGAYTSGQLTPTQQAAVDQFKKQQLAKWRQYLTSAGIPEGSAMADIEAKVNTDAQVYADKLLQQDFQNAYAAAGLNTSNLTNIARQQALQDAEQRKAWADFMQQLAKIGGDIGPIMVGGNNP